MSPASKKTTSRIIRLKVPQRAGKSTRAPKGTKSLKGTKSSKGPKSLKGPKPQKTAKVAKAPKVAKPPKKRRFSDTSSSLDLSSDGGYSELEDADDSDDEDEDDVEAAEAEHYTTRDTGELLRDDHVASSSSRPRLSEDEDAENSDDDDDDPSVDVNLVEGTDSEDDQPNSDDAEDSPEWAGFQSDMDESVSEQPILKPILNQDPPKDERRVRFAVPSDSDDTDDDEEMLEFFPDIFIAQEALDSNFRREIEEDPDDSSNSGTYWDYSNGQEANPWFVDSDVEVFQNPSYATTPVATPLGSQYSADFDFTKASNDVTGFEEFEGLDGYETDGDTTEDDLPAPPPRKKHSIRRALPAHESDSEADEPSKTQRAKPGSVGRFKTYSADDKPICVVNPETLKMMIFTPPRLRRPEISPEQYNMDYDFLNLEAENVQSSPIMTNPGSLMMSAMISSNTFGDFLHQQPCGPAEAFFALATEAMEAGDSSDSYIPDEEDDEEQGLRIEDFINFDGHSSDEEDQGENSDDGNTDAVSTPSRRPSTAASAAGDASALLHPLINHFDNNSNSVGAFRRNQVDQQLILSDKATQDSLAFANPIGHGILRGIKPGSLGNIGSPLTPERRQKKSANSFPKSPLDPGSQKRKADPSGLIEDANAHKRQRSISDVQAMHIG